MRSRCMSLLPRTTLHSDSEQQGLPKLHLFNRKCWWWLAVFFSEFSTTIGLQSVSYLLRTAHLVCYTYLLLLLYFLHLDCFQRMKTAAAFLMNTSHASVSICQSKKGTSFTLDACTVTDNPLHSHADFIQLPAPHLSIPCIQVYCLTARSLYCLIKS